MPEHGPVIRAATPTDSVAIAAVAASVWPEEPLDAQVIAALIATTERATSVAVLGDDVVGFVDGFLTETQSGEPRWEVDLLVVSPVAQGHGIGRSLVRTNVEAGVAAGATSARGLIRTGNIASERVFAACGFLSDDVVRQLWVTDRLSLPTDSNLFHVVPVRTFRYGGVWLEDLTPAGLHAIRFGGSGVTGALIPVDDRETSAAAYAAGFRSEGDYRFWRQMLTPAQFVGRR